MRCLARGFGTAQEGESIQGGAIQGAQEENTALGERSGSQKQRNTPLSIEEGAASPQLPAHRRWNWPSGFWSLASG